MIFHMQIFAPLSKDIFESQKMKRRKITCIQLIILEKIDEILGHKLIFLKLEKK